MEVPRRPTEKAVTVLAPNPPPPQSEDTTTIIITGRFKFNDTYCVEKKMAK